MWFFYLFSLFPLVIGLFLWLFKRKIVLTEWLASTIMAFLFSGLTHILVITGMTGDIETWSGHITKAIHSPSWVERYTVTVTHSSGTGKNRKTWTTTETRHRTHPEHWDTETTLDSEISISSDLFNDISKNFNNLTTEQPHKSGFHSGDPNIYVAYNKTGFIYPVNEWRKWENRVKAAPSVFSYSKVPTNIAVFNYPENNNPFRSDRLIGDVKGKVGLLEFDRMNDRLGSSKQVNVIIIGFVNQDESISKWQEAKWIGGKKNDLVLCYNVIDNRVTWSYVFGWTEKTLVKRNLETILLDNSINNDIIPIIEREIRSNYVIRDWSKLDYISLEPPLWSYIVFILLMASTQVIYWLWAFYNEHQK